jgi:hypothetical protein
MIDISSQISKNKNRKIGLSYRLATITLITKMNLKINEVKKKNTKRRSQNDAWLLLDGYY